MGEISDGGDMTYIARQERDREPGMDGRREEPITILPGTCDEMQMKYTGALEDMFKGAEAGDAGLAELLTASESVVSTSLELLGTLIRGPNSDDPNTRAERVIIDLLDQTTDDQERKALELLRRFAKRTGGGVFGPPKDENPVEVLTDIFSS